jgi:hypothetical protein
VGTRLLKDNTSRMSGINLTECEHNLGLGEASFDGVFGN